MCFRPARKIFPAAKLTADNAGDLELTSHRRAVANASAALKEPPTSAALKEPLACPTSRSSSPLPASSPPPPTDTEDGTDDAFSQSRSSSKRSLSRDSIVVSPTASDVASDPTDPTPKRVKSSVAGPPIPPDAPIINIDDVDDPLEELLNKTDPTADISHFFTPAPRVPGQPKARMKCIYCA